MNHTYNGMPAAELPDVTWEKSKHSIHASRPARRWSTLAPRSRHSWRAPRTASSITYSHKHNLH
jgi:hypothetical protein